MVSHDLATTKNPESYRLIYWYSLSRAFLASCRKGQWELNKIYLLESSFEIIVCCIARTKIRVNVSSSHLVMQCWNTHAGLVIVNLYISWYDIEHDNFPVAKSPQCTSPISHNATFCNGNVHRYAHFCLQNAALWDFVWCIMKFLRWNFAKAENKSAFEIKKRIATPQINGVFLVIFFRKLTLLAQDRTIFCHMLEKNPVTQVVYISTGSKFWNGK